ncbi:MAG: CehA/McbA family metallohydrolase [Planctomycetaceae bacterium]
MPDGNPFDVEGVWLKAALHTHTRRSDGELEPDAHVRHHEWMGFDVVAITDHWTLTSVPATGHLVVITGAELAADPFAGAPNDSELLAIGIREIPEDPGGDRARWGPIDAYHYKTFPTLSDAARCVAEQGGVSFVAHPAWSGLTLETLLAAEGADGIELFNSSAERENGRGDSSYVWDQCLERGRRLWAFGTDDCHYPGFDIGDAWTMLRAAERSEAAVLEALRRGHAYASNGPELLDVIVDGGAVEVGCSPARSVVLASRYETGWAVRADARNRMEDARILERDDRGLVVRARFTPPIELPYRRIVVEDERGRKAWSNPL